MRKVRGQPSLRTRRNMRLPSLFVGFLTLMLLLSLTPLGICQLWVGDGGGGGGSTPTHSVYQGSATCTGTNPCLTLSVAIDTTADVWTAKWQGEGYLITPVPGIYSAFTILFEDSKGFIQKYNSLEHGVSHNGEITIQNYVNTGCWTHTWCSWSYSFIVPGGIGFISYDLWVDLYVT